LGLFVETAGIAPATRRRQAMFFRYKLNRTQAFSRFALIAGGTPAVPVSRLRTNRFDYINLDGPGKKQTV
jgi:hypothetical protein